MLIVRDIDSGVCGEWRMLRIGEAVHVCRLGKIWEISLTFTQFCCELKVALKFIKTRTNKTRLINSLDNLFPFDGYTTHLTFLFLAQLSFLYLYWDNFFVPICTKSPYTVVYPYCFQIVSSISLLNQPLMEGFSFFLKLFFLKVINSIYVSKSNDLSFYGCWPSSSI